MIQVFILGASSAYGVGAAQAGWADLIKQHLHARMYKPGGMGETYEVFNFAKPGATIDFVLETFPKQLADFGRDTKPYIFFSVGGNNAKAEGSPDNFVSTPQQYRQQMDDLLRLLSKHAERVVAVAQTPVDESKTNPKISPFSGGKSYFTNARRTEFTTILQQLCKKHGATCVLPPVGQTEWVQRYTFDDGLHPNQAGHQLIFEQLREYLPDEPR